MTAAGQMQKLFRYWSGGGIVGIVIGLALAIAAVALIAALWIPIAAVAIALAVARKRWPRVSPRAYFNSKKAALPLIAAVCGFGIAIVASALTSRAPETLTTIAGGLLSTVALSLLLAIFQERIMKSIFALVPPDQQSGLREFLQGRDPNTAGGQFADFSQLDSRTVTESIKSRVIGQDAIVDDVVTTAFRRARLRRPNKPLAVFLFVGATGAGKTELSKALSESLFDGRLIRVDCNELSQPHQVARLIGAPPGYVGSEQGGQLCREIGRVGTGVLLFDEIEKADPAVMKVVMGLLDEARLTEQSTGTTYNATGFLIVLTSNAAAQGIAKVAASIADTQERAAKVKDELKGAGFLPEVLARIDSIFPFGPLSRSAVAEIVGRFLMKFSGDTGVELVALDAELLVSLVTKQEKLSAYGVREVVRLVENTVVDGLLSVKDAGYKQAAIRVRDGHVSVERAGA